MSLALQTSTRVPAGIALLIAVQAGCVVFFAGDVVLDYGVRPEEGLSVHLVVEAVATLALVAAIVVEGRWVLELLRRKARLERSLELARGAVQEVIDAHFAAWGLSPAETDVALFLVKGLEIAEIARVRGSAEGTVKAHLNAIYRKSGTKGRGELLSVLIDSMLARDVG